MRVLLRAARQAVLAGCTVLFSRVMPLDCRDPAVHPLWQLALKVRRGLPCQPVALCMQGCVVAV